MFLMQPSTIGKHTKQVFYLKTDCPENALTQERFIKLIDNPDLLATITLEELKTLAFDYPYAHNLRYLLALKAAQTNHADAARFLQAAAAYSLDRKQLFMLVVPPQLTPVPVSVADAESVLELKPIETVQKALDALSPLARNVENTASNKSISLPETSTAPTTVPPTETVLANPTDVPTPSADLPVFTPIVPIASPPDPILAPKQVPQKQSFEAWFVQFQPPSLVLVRPAPAPMKKIKPQPQNRKEPVLTGVAQVLAEKSVAENQSVISETLARLLVQQGYKEKAINMYQRLSLAFPEKSAYFAAEIDKLKK
jgi:hypothetical protein